MEGSRERENGAREIKDRGFGEKANQGRSGGGMGRQGQGENVTGMMKKKGDKPRARERKVKAKRLLVMMSFLLR